MAAADVPPIAPNELADLLAATMPWGATPRRLLHGRGHTIAGATWLSVDWFAPILKFTVHLPETTTWLGEWEHAVADAMAPVLTAARAQGCLLQHRTGAATAARLLWGEPPPAPHIVTEAGLQYEVRLGEQQNDGLFLDMAPVRQWLRERVADKKVLNLFAYTCAFAVVADAGGATSVANLDMSRPALAWGQRNVSLNQNAVATLSDNSTRKTVQSFYPHNIFKSWWKLRKLAPFDLVICDPPTRQRGSFDARRDYRTVLKRMPELLAPGGQLLACLNAPALDRNFLADTVSKAWPEGEFLDWLAPSADFPDESVDRGLKVALYRRPLN